MALEGKAEGNFFSAVSEMFKFLVSCELTQFPISKSNAPLCESQRSVSSRCDGCPLVTATEGSVPLHTALKSLLNLGPLKTNDKVSTARLSMASRQ
jgi:hypothetical protein